MITRRRLFEALTALAGGALIASAALAQVPPPDRDTLIFVAGPECPDGGGARLPLDAAGGKTVTGQPFSAEGRSVMTSVLRDGNRIVRITSTRHFRDSRGRTRAEHEFSGVGPFATEGTVSVVEIHDPVAKLQIFLHPADRRADVAKITGTPFLPGSGTRVANQSRGEAAPGGSLEVAPGGSFTCNDRQAAKVVSLGAKKIDGLHVTGSRSQYEIPAGQIGNELPMIVSSEEWFSPELGVVVASTHTDPLLGETEYRLERIVRREPDAALFMIPRNYARNELPTGPGEGEHILVSPPRAPLPGSR
jgi:hypothetical protein